MKHNPYQFIKKNPMPIREGNQTNLRYAFALRKYIDTLHSKINEQAKELEQLFEREIQSISNDEQLPQKWEKLLTKFMLLLKREVLGDISHE